MNILLTGATGFIGRALTRELLSKSINLTVAVRKKSNVFSEDVKQLVMDDAVKKTNFAHILKNIDCILHLAGKAHVVKKIKKSASDELREINIDLTLSLARQAADAGVKRLVFLSSIGVNGNQNNQPYTEVDTPNPKGPYAVSKYKAELGLMEIAGQSNLEVVIIRSPLVYALNAPGNFGRVIRWAMQNHPIPLPLGAVHNVRSIVALNNLVDFIILCSTHPKASNEIFLISDGCDISTTELLKVVLKSLGKKTWLFPFPTGLLFFLARLLGKEDSAISLFSSLQVDNSKAYDLLGWKPITDIKGQLQLAGNNEKSI